MRQVHSSCNAAYKAAKQMKSYDQGQLADSEDIFKYPTHAMLHCQVYKITRGHVDITTLITFSRIRRSVRHILWKKKWFILSYRPSYFKHNPI